MNRVIAIDPGNKKSAFALLTILDGNFTIDRHGILENELLLLEMETWPDRPMAIEMVQSMGMAVGKEVFETVWWTGRFCQAWEGYHLRVFRSEVKMHLCGNMRAKDTNIRQALLDKIGPQGTKCSPGPTYGVKADIWSAIAVGVTWIEKYGCEAKPV